MDTASIILLVVTVLLITLLVFYMDKTKTQRGTLAQIQYKMAENRNARLPPAEWSSPSKCFSCENQMSSQQKYLAEPSKCYSCERQTSRSMGPQFAIREQTTKCFDC
jgi:hypothetical protein